MGGDWHQVGGWGVGEGRGKGRGKGRGGSHLVLTGIYLAIHDCILVIQSIVSLYSSFLAGNNGYVY